MTGYRTRRLLINNHRFETMFQSVWDRVLHRLVFNGRDKSGWNRISLLWFRDRGQLDGFEFVGAFSARIDGRIHGMLSDNPDAGAKPQ